MKKVLTFFIVSILLFLPSSPNLKESKAAAKEEFIYQVETKIETKKFDKRAKILTDYLAKYNSPLQYHAQDFVDAADQYGLDWKMLPSIAGVESTFGKRIPGGYNAWGWGVYGKNSIYFRSWKDGIFTLAKGLRENYLNRGLEDLYSINRAYATSKTWGFRVTFFMNDLEKHSQKYQVQDQKISQIVGLPKIAAVSGQLSLRVDN